MLSLCLKKISSFKLLEKTAPPPPSPENQMVCPIFTNQIKRALIPPLNIFFLGGGGLNCY